MWRIPKWSLATRVDSNKGNFGWKSTPPFHISVGAGISDWQTLSPLNFAIPLIGVLDDFVIVPLALHWMLKLMPQQLLEDYAAAAPRA